MSSGVQMREPGNVRSALVMSRVKVPFCTLLLPASMAAKWHCVSLAPCTTRADNDVLVVPHLFEWRRPWATPCCRPC